MPPPDGIELTRQIRSSRLNRVTPVIVITGETEHGVSKTGRLTERIAFRLPPRAGTLYQLMKHRGLHHGFQFVHKRTIPPTLLYFLAYESKSAFRRHRFAIRTICSKGVVNIHDLQNSGRQRDRVAFQTVRVPTAVHFLVVVTDNRQNGSKRLEWRADTGPDNRVLLHDLALFGCQGI